MTSLLVKAEGAGNDFLLGTGDWCLRLADDPDLVAGLCRRRLGIGADGVLAVERCSATEIRTRHRNADGSPSTFCANGTRCAALAAVELLGCARELRVRTDWAEIAARVGDDGVTLDLPAPEDVGRITLETTMGRQTGWRLRLGVPHLILPVTDLGAVDMERTARVLRTHPDLGPGGANVHLVERVAEDRIAIRSYERGVEAEVLCCGSGVVAAALASRTGEDNGETVVIPRSGAELRVTSLGRAPETPSRLRGPARLVAVVDPLD